MSGEGSFDSERQSRPRWEQGADREALGAGLLSSAPAPGHPRSGPCSRLAGARRGRQPGIPAGTGQERLPPSPNSECASPAEDFPVSWAEGQARNLGSVPPRSGAGPSGIRPAARPCLGVISVAAESGRRPSRPLECGWAGGPGLRGYSSSGEGLAGVAGRARPGRVPALAGGGPARTPSGWASGRQTPPARPLQKDLQAVCGA